MSEYQIELLARAHDAILRLLHIAESVELERLRPFFLLRPRVFPDGNQWCALYGDNLQEGVCAFGDTPAKAATQFDIEWLNAKAGPPAQTEEQQP
jgi:hypothetical protein